MSMALDLEDEGEVMSEINMTPLVDVMLVLLIIFIVTIPVMNHAVKLELPKANSQPVDSKPQRLDLALDAAGSLRWAGQPVAGEALESRLTALAGQSPQPEIHLRADRRTPYEHVARLLALCGRLGLTRIAFVTEPVGK